MTPADIDIFARPLRMSAPAVHDPEVYDRAKSYVASQLSKPEDLRTKAAARLAEQRKALRDLGNLSG